MAIYGNAITLPVQGGGLNWTQVTLTSTTGTLQGLLDQIFSGVTMTNKVMAFRWVGSSPTNSRMLMGTVSGTVCMFVRYLNGKQTSSSTNWSATGATYAADDVYEWAEIGDYSDY